MNCFFKLLSRLPLRLLQTVGAAVGELTFWLSPGYRRRTRGRATTRTSSFAVRAAPRAVRRWRAFGSGTALRTR